jgi:DNA-binding transcriptional MerR regulator
VIPDNVFVDVLKMRDVVGRKPMAYTVKQVAAISGVSVRTLHFYHETGLLKPAHCGANNYRFYEESQLLMLQQILFYRELGFELKQIKRILGQADFEKLASLQSHREVLEENVSHARKLLETIDKTIKHLSGKRKMKAEEMFIGFRVASGRDRFEERIRLDGAPVDCKLSAEDTAGAMCAFEVAVAWPRHLHHDQDEWLYVIEGQVAIEVNAKRYAAGAGESVFIPRKVAHAWGPMGEKAARIINVYQPAGRIDEFFRELASADYPPSREQLTDHSYTDEQVTNLSRLFEAYGMELLPPLTAE